MMITAKGKKGKADIAEGCHEGSPAERSLEIPGRKQ